MTKPNAWRRVDRIPLFRSKQMVGVPTPRVVVGAAELAIDGRGLRLLLARGDLSVTWEGHVRDVRVDGWCGTGSLLLRDLRDLSAVVWDVGQRKVGWTAPGNGGTGTWLERVVLCPTPGVLQVRDGATGAVIREGTYEEKVEAPYYIVRDMAICRAGWDWLVGVSLPTLDVSWRINLRQELSGMYDSEERRAPAVWPLSEHGLALVLQNSAMAMLDAGQGAFLWRTRAPTRSLAQGGWPLVTRDRVGFFWLGTLDLFDSSNGRLVSHQENVARTIYDSPPVAWGDWMVVVDERGQIVTLGLEGGGIVGVQVEKGASFGACQGLDGRLLIGGRDGALWVYEPAGAAGVAAQAVAKNAPSSPEGRAARDYQPGGSARVRPKKGSR